MNEEQDLRRMYSAAILMTLSMGYDLTIIPQDIHSIHSKVLLLLPVDPKDCAYISHIFQTPGRELYHQTSLMTSLIITGMYSTFEHMYSIIHACTCTLSFYFCCIWGHAHLYTHHFQAIATSILSLYPQGLNEQGMNPGLPLNLALFKFCID